MTAAVLGKAALAVAAIRRHFAFPAPPAAPWARSARWPTPAATTSRTASASPGCWPSRAAGPGSCLDVQAMAADFVAFSCHKLLAPFGVGVLYARERLLREWVPFLYGGDMIAGGQVFPDRVEYNALPWMYAAGTPNILGAVVSAQALRLQPRWSEVEPHRISDS